MLNINDFVFKLYNYPNMNFWCAEQWSVHSPQRRCLPTHRPFLHSTCCPWCEKSPFLQIICTFSSLSKRLLSGVIRCLVACGGRAGRPHLPVTGGSHATSVMARSGPQMAISLIPTSFNIVLLLVSFWIEFSLILGKPFLLGIHEWFQWNV